MLTHSLTHSLTGTEYSIHPNCMPLINRRDTGADVCPLVHLLEFPILRWCTSSIDVVVMVVVVKLQSCSADQYKCNSVYTISASGMLFSFHFSLVAWSYGAGAQDGPPPKQIEP